MGLLDSFKYAIVAKKLKDIGCVLKYKCRGSHEIWYNPFAEKEFPVVNHGADNMRKGTLCHMLGVADIDIEKFLEAKPKSK